MLLLEMVTITNFSQLMLIIICITLNCNWDQEFSAWTMTTGCISKQRLFILDLLFVVFYIFWWHNLAWNLSRRGCILMQNFWSQLWFYCALCMGAATEVITKDASFIDFLQTNLHIGCSYQSDCAQQYLFHTKLMTVYPLETWHKRLNVCIPQK